jgi:hypothetical protein
VFVGRGGAAIRDVQQIVPRNSRDDVAFDPWCPSSPTATAIG